MGGKRRDRQQEIVCMGSHMDFRANSVIRTQLYWIKEGTLSVIIKPIYKKRVGMKIVSV